MNKRSKILIVDDEPVVLGMIRLAVQTMGDFNVSAHTDSGAALSEFEDDPAGFSLVITDFNMPGINGAELAGLVRARNPMVPILCISAFLEADVPVDTVFTARLPKPFDLGELRDLVNTHTQAPIGLPAAQAAADHQAGWAKV